MTASAALQSPLELNKRTTLLRWLLLSLVLVAFARVVWQLGDKNLWWDESLSLQRAESGLLALLRGMLLIQDGFTTAPTTDQHPFFFFLVQGLLIRLAGSDEFVLRFPSAMAATLLAPMVWVFARYLVRRALLPASAPVWSTLLAAVNPFLLWYGQEARPYALWALLALVSTYLLVRCTETDDRLTTPAADDDKMTAKRVVRKSSAVLFVGYGIVLLCFLATHYYAVFFLPVHAFILYQWLARRHRRLALIAALAVLGLGVLIGALAAWIILGQGGGVNFPEISLGILIPDLVNAFSLGLSVDIVDVRWLDWIYALVALMGASGLLRSRVAIARQGWLLPALLVTPICLILLLNAFQPAYMNSRHLSLLGGVYVLLLGAGLSVLWQLQKVATILVALVLLAGAGYSTNNYFTSELYDKDDYVGMGAFVAEHLLPGDLLLISPPFSWRIFDYYLPIEQLDQAAQRGVDVAHYGVPLIWQSWETTYATLENLQGRYRRIWLARSGTHPYLDPEGKVSAWLLEHSARQLRVEKFDSYNSFLDLELYLSQPPVVEGLTPPPMQHPVDATFGDQIRIVGYDIGRPIFAGGAIPVTLYWQVPVKDDQTHYKYILQLVEPLANGAIAVVGVTEREPFNGEIPTIYWDPGKTIVEPVELLPGIQYDEENPARYQLTLQLYPVETLAKLPVAAQANAAVATDGQTLLLPYVPE